MIIISIANEIIRKSNALKQLTREELDLFVYVMSKAKEQYKNKDWENYLSVELNINFVDYYEKVKNTKWSRLNQNIKFNYVKSIIALSRKSFFIYKDKDNKEELETNLKNIKMAKALSKYNYIIFDKYEEDAINDYEKIKVQIQTKTLDFFCDMGEHFTPILLKNLYNLKLRNSKLIYIFFRSYMETEEGNLKGFKEHLEYFRKQLGFENDYRIWNDFRRNVLLPSIKEINEKTDIFITGYKEEMDHYLKGEDFNSLDEMEKANLISKAIGVNGYIGKNIEYIQVHVLDKKSSNYINYYKDEKIA